MSIDLNHPLKVKSDGSSTPESELLADLKIEILCNGIKCREVNSGRKGGAGPSGGRYIVLPDGNVVNAPMRGKFVEKSPLELKKREENWIIFRDGEQITEVSLIPTPSFHERKTSDGTWMKNIAKLHGKNCLATTLLSKCYRFRQGKGCKFCGIEEGEDKGTPKKSPQQLVEVAKAADEEEQVEHMTITTGTTSGPDRGAVILAEAVEEIKEEALDVPVHVQLEPPESLDFLDLLEESGVDTVGMHLETFDEGLRRKVCPGKAEVSIEKYLDTFSYAVNLFGEMQVSSFLLAGLGQSSETMLEGARKLADKGVMPFVVPLRPTPSTPASDWSSPNPDSLIEISRELSKIFENHGLFEDSPKAGCPRCGACGLDINLLKAISEDR